MDYSISKSEFCVVKYLYIWNKKPALGAVFLFFSLKARSTIMDAPIIQSWYACHTKPKKVYKPKLVKPKPPLGDHKP